MDHMHVEDSYAERRQLFKNIWETAMNINDKNPDIMNKPKVIKTLRLDEVDRCAISKKKKLKLKNLRSVCNKLLDFCDKQEADDIIYEKMKAERQFRLQHPTHIKHKKVKKTAAKKKVKASRSLSSPTEDPAQAKSTLSEKKDAKSYLPKGKEANCTSPKEKNKLNDIESSQDCSVSKETINTVRNNKPSKKIRNSSVPSKPSSYRKTVKKNTKVK